MASSCACAGLADGPPPAAAAAADSSMFVKRLVGGKRFEPVTELRPGCSLVLEEIDCRRDWPIPSLLDMDTRAGLAVSRRVAYGGKGRSSEELLLMLDVLLRRPSLRRSELLLELEVNEAMDADAARLPLFARPLSDKEGWILGFLIGTAPRAHESMRGGSSSVGLVAYCVRCMYIP